MMRARKHRSAAEMAAALAAEGPRNAPAGASPIADPIEASARESFERDAGRPFTDAEWLEAQGQLAAIGYDRIRSLTPPPPLAILRSPSRLHQVRCERLEPADGVSAA